jgi:hypothetical protein
MLNTLRILLFFLMLGFTLNLNAQQFIYSHSGTRVFKADTTGNVYWVKNFAGKINPLINDSNVIVRMALNGNRIYVQLIQYGGSSGYYPAVATLDTAGNLIHCFYWNIQASGFNAAGILPSFTNGAWLLYEADSWFVISTHTISLMVKIDSTGHLSQNTSIPTIDFAYTNRYLETRKLRDSTYLIVTDVHTLLTPGSYFAFTRYSETGQLISQHSYMPDYSDWLDFNSMAIDTSGNIYIIALYTGSNGTINSIAGIKTILNGNILLKKAWPSLPIGNHYLRIQNNLPVDNFVYSTGSPLLSADLFFDSLLNSPCVSDSVVHITDGFSGTNDTVTFHESITFFIPFQDTISYHYTGGGSGTILPDYCNILAITENKLIGNNYNVWFDDASDQIIVDSKSKIENVLIYSSEGRVLLEHQCNGRYIRLNASKLQAGIYIVRIVQDNMISSQRMMVLR